MTETDHATDYARRYLDYLAQMGITPTEHDRIEIHQAAVIAAALKPPVSHSKRRFAIFARLHEAGFNIALCSVLATLVAG